MVKLEHPDALYLLLGLIPLIVLFVLFMLGRKRAIKRFGDSRLMSLLSPGSPKFKHQVKFILICLAYISIVIALANPQIGQKVETVQRSGVDLIIALDISRSMLAEDVKPNRLSRARQFVSRLIDNLAGDRVGLIIFAGNAYLQVPLTSDYAAAKTFLQTITTELAPTQGTAIGEAIRMAGESFDQGEAKYKAMLIISDGENHEEDAIDAATEAAEKGVVIHTLGIGTIKGAPIPVYRSGIQADYKRDNSGSIVFSKLNENMLQQVALSGEGTYLGLGQGSGEINTIMNELAGMEQKEFEERVFTDYEDQFQWFIALALFFVVIEYFISERRNAWISRWDIFRA